MLLEIHAHTSKHSKCSILEPVWLIRQAEKKGMQGVVITEHHYLWSDRELAELRSESEVNETFLILAAQEVETDIGHILVYGADESIDKKISLNALRRKFPRAALVWAHPLRNGKRPSADKLLDPHLDAIEIFNVNHEAKDNYRGLSLWHKYKFTAVAGSDAHAVGTTALYPTQFDHPVSSIKELITEIKGGRCRPFIKEIPKSGSNLTVTEITMGTKGTDERRSRLITKKFRDKRAWTRAKAALSVREALYEGFASGKFRVPGTLDIDDRNKLIIEEGQRGSTLFQMLSYVNTKVGRQYFDLTARWLSRMHRMRLKMQRKEDTERRERMRLDAYRRTFIETKSPYLKEAGEMISFVMTKEKELFVRRGEAFVQCHGDYHPKNVVIGQDRMHDISTLFISVIDFDNSIFFLRSFDLGYFISQFAYQFRGIKALPRVYREARFISAYLNDAEAVPANFADRIDFFKLRANLSISAFLIKVGKGESPDMEYLFTESRRIREKLRNFKW